MDYDAIAQQFGGDTSPVNYDVLASQHGGSIQPAPVKTVQQVSAPTWYENLLAKMPDIIPAKLESQVSGFVRGTASPSVGAAQLAAHVVGSSALDQAIQEKQQQYDAGKALTGRDGIDVPELLGNVASPVNLLAARAIPIAASLPKMIGQGLAMGAGSGALTPVSNNDGNYWTDKATQAGAGAALGGVGAGVLGGTSSVIAPKASQAWNNLNDSGVFTTIGQRLGGAANAVEEKSQSIPLIGDFIRNARNKSLDSWNMATLNQVVDPIGGKVTTIGHDGVKQAGDMISSAYDAAKAKLGGFKVDPQAQSEFGNLETLAANLPETEQKIFSKTMAKIQQQKSPNGSYTSDVFKTLDSSLGTDAKSYQGSTDAYQRQLGDAIAEAKNILFNNAKRANPDAAAQLNAADSAYARLVRVEGASKSAASNKENTGIFTPSQLMSAVKGADKSVRDRATARGDALMQDWAQNGLKVLGNKVADSGTAGRGANMAALGALATNPAWLPAAGAAAGLGAAVYSSPVQRILVGAATNRPAMAEPIAGLLQNASPYLTLPSAGIVGGLLSNR